MVFALFYPAKRRGDVKFDCWSSHFSRTVSHNNVTQANTLALMSEPNCWSSHFHRQFPTIMSHTQTHWHWWVTRTVWALIFTDSFPANKAEEYRVGVLRYGVFVRYSEYHNKLRTGNESSVLSLREGSPSCVRTRHCWNCRMRTQDCGKSRHSTTVVLLLSC